MKETIIKVIESQRDLWQDRLNQSKNLSSPDYMNSGNYTALVHEYNRLLALVRQVQ